MAVIMTKTNEKSHSTPGGKRNAKDGAELVPEGKFLTSKSSRGRRSAN